MATKSTSSATKPSERTAAEMQDILMARDMERQELVFKAISEQLRLIDLTKDRNRTFTTFDKSRLRTFMRNPKQNESRLIELSWFLYRMCYPYRRIIWYYATMPKLNAISVAPVRDITKEMTDAIRKKTRKAYYNTVKRIQTMDMPHTMLPLLVQAWIQDTAYGYIYADNESFFIHPLPYQYCKISSIDRGVFRFAFDFKYFDTYTDDLDFWAPEFKQKYRKYLRDNDLRWQELDYSKQICIKVNLDDPTMNMPPLAGMFNSIIDNTDLADIQRVKDELSIYKLLIARLKPLSSTKSPDDFEVDIKTAIRYYDKMADMLPPEIGFALSPLPIEQIEFNPTSTSDNDMISNSTRNLFKNAGGANVLYSDATNSTLILAQMKADAEAALSSLLPQIQKWTNVWLTDDVGKDHASVTFMRVSPYTIEAKKDELLKSAQYSLPVAMAVGALDGFTPLEMIALGELENDILDIRVSWKPLQSSHTQSGSGVGSDVDSSVGGRPKQDEVTDEGERSRDKE